MIYLLSSSSVSYSTFNLSYIMIIILILLILTQQTIATNISVAYCISPPLREKTEDTNFGGNLGFLYKQFFDKRFFNVSVVYINCLLSGKLVNGKYDGIVGILESGLSDTSGNPIEMFFPNLKYGVAVNTADGIIISVFNVKLLEADIFKSAIGVFSLQIIILIVFLFGFLQVLKKYIIFLKKIHYKRKYNQQSRNNNNAIPNATYKKSLEILNLLKAFSYTFISIYFLCSIKTELVVIEKKGIINHLYDILKNENLKPLFNSKNMFNRFKYINYQPYKGIAERVEKLGIENCVFDDGNPIGNGIAIIEKLNQSSVYLTTTFYEQVVKVFYCLEERKSIFHVGDEKYFGYNMGYAISPKIDMHKYKYLSLLYMKYFESGYTLKQRQLARKVIEQLIGKYYAKSNEFNKCMHTTVDKVMKIYIKDKNFMISKKNVSFTLCILGSLAFFGIILFIAENIKRI